MMFCVLRSQSAFDAKGIKGITATVSNGEVTLTGDVKKADLQKVMQVANESKPKKVNQPDENYQVTNFIIEKFILWHYRINTRN